MEGVRLEDGLVVQELGPSVVPRTRCSEMIGHADGVLEVRLERDGALVRAKVVTRALVHLLIGIDDTDAAGGGATFALALALLQHLARLEGVQPIGHRVVMLDPRIEERTAGTPAAYLELRGRAGRAGRRGPSRRAVRLGRGLLAGVGRRDPERLPGAGSPARIRHPRPFWTVTREEAVVVAAGAARPCTAGAG